MSKYHKIQLGGEEFTVRDVPIQPFHKKFRVAPYELRDKIIDMMDDAGKSLVLRYINTRIHFFAGADLIANADDEYLAQFLQQNIHLKNEIII